MPISRLRIRNFQVVREADFKLGTITAIVGPSMSGKSSVMRALRNLSTAAVGHSFVTAGEDRCLVVVKLDGAAIGWSKGKGVNKYMLGREPFDKVGRDVPQPIAELLGFTTVEVKEKKLLLNIQQQLDPPFMVGEIGSTISAMLGAAVGYDKLVLVVTKVAARITQLQSQESSLEVLVEESTEKFERLAGAPDIIGDSKKLKHDSQKLAAEEIKLCAAEEQMRQAIEHYRVVKAIGPAVNFTERLLEYAGTRSKLEWAEARARDATRLKGEVAVLTEASNLLADLATQVKAEQECNKQEAKLEEFGLFERSIGRIEANITKLMRETPKQIARKMKEIWPKLQGSACPVCGRAMDATCLEQLRVYIKERVEALTADGGS